MKTRPTNRTNHNIPVYFVLVCVLMAAVWQFSWGINLRLTGSWNITANQSDLTGGGGSDFKTEFLSPLDAVFLKIRRIRSKPWEVDVRRQDVFWRVEFTLYAKRSSDGIGNPNKSGIFGGTQFLELQDSDNLFFSGWGTRHNVGLQFKLTGLTAAVPADIYSTNIVYTAIDTH